MGNILRVPILGYSGSPRFPCHLQLPSAAIDMSIDVKKKDDGELLEAWNVSYKVDGSTCDLCLTRYVDEGGNITSLHFFVSDGVHMKNGYILFKIKRSATSTLPELSCSILRYDSPGSKTNRTVNAWGGFTETKINLYGWTGNRGGVYVEEWKMNSKDDPFMAVTVAHYFALNIPTEISIGLSVVAKIRAYKDGKLDVIVEGPEQHPASALLYMFDEVNRTGIWKPTMCPHCAQTQRHLSRMSWPSDTEDSDSDPLPLPRGSRQNTARIANSGWFKGHASGSNIRCRNFYGYNSGKDLDMVYVMYQ